MTTLGAVLVGAAIVTGAWGFAWALCNAARIGDEGISWLEDDQATVDAEFHALTDELERP